MTQVILPVLRAVIGAAVMLAPAAASADVVWQLTKKQGRPFLQGASSEPETDKEFWAHCAAAGAIEIGVGAESNVGKGDGEAVTLTLLSGGTRAVLAGHSRKSADFQMTAGTELRAKVSSNDAVFTVLATDKPITVSGSIKTVTWPVKGLKTKVAAFLQACK